jgi:apolipoprotein N-acyltransferase
MIRFFLAALTGVLGFLSFPKYALDFCVWFALVPLLVAVSATRLRGAFWLGYLAAVVGFCGAFPWVVPTIARFEDVSLMAAFALAMPAAAYHALQLGIFAAFAASMMGDRAKRHSRPHPEPYFHRLRTKEAHEHRHSEETRGGGAEGLQDLAVLLSIASAWVVLEWSFPKVFPWSFATVLSERLTLIQIVEVTGVWGLSFGIAAVNAALAIGIVSWRDHRHIAWRPLALATSLVLALWSFGSARLKEGAERRDSQALTPTRSQGAQGEREAESLAGFALTVAVIQGNVGSGPRDPVAEGQTFSIYRQLTLRPPGASLAAAPFGAAHDRLSIQSSGLVIWPETTIRAVLPETQHYREALFDVAAQLQRPILVGSLDAADLGRAEFNSLFVITPDRQIAGVYHKTRLLPFGESAPLLGSWWRTTGRFTNGEPPKILPVSLAVARSSSVVRGGAAQTLLEEDASGTEHDSRTRLTTLFAPSICYEALFPGFFNAMVRDGAQFLVNITDDSWFGNGNAPWQHLQGAVFRAVETRRTLVRASNSGISALIDPSGRITARTELFTRTVMQGIVRPKRGETLYVRWGDWFAWLCVGMVVLGRTQAGFTAHFSGLRFKQTELIQ